LTYIKSLSGVEVAFEWRSSGVSVPYFLMKLVH
jgi:hypothetical protein